MHSRKQILFIPAPDFCLSNPSRRKRNNAPLRDAPASMSPGVSPTPSNTGAVRGSSL